MESSRLSVSPQRPNLPARFESLNDDTLGLILKFVGRRSYRSFGGMNRQCKEVYLSSGMAKETFLSGYAPLSRVINKIIEEEELQQHDIDWDLIIAVGKGVLFYNRSDVMDWAVQDQNKRVLSGICLVAGEEGRLNILDEVWNNVDDEDDKQFVFGGVDFHAARGGKLNVMKWLEDKGLCIEKEYCAEIAVTFGQLHILKWLKEEKDLELDGGCYHEAILGGGHLHIMKWLREQEVDWDGQTFYAAASEGNLDILQWLHDEGCPWVGLLPVREHWLKPEVVDWCRVNGYGNRIFMRR